MGCFFSMFSKMTPPAIKFIIFLEIYSIRNTFLSQVEINCTYRKCVIWSLLQNNLSREDHCPENIIALFISKAVADYTSGLVFVSSALGAGPVIRPGTLSDGFLFDIFPPSGHTYLLKVSPCPLADKPRPVFINLFSSVTC